MERFTGSLCEAIARDGDGPKTHLRGTHRLLSVERTAERLRSLMPQLGITRLADITGLDRIGVPVAMACRPNSRSVSVSQGKGLTFAAAAASALVEAAELYHAERMLAPILYATATRMMEDGCSIVCAELWRESNMPFDLNRSLAWAAAQDLRSGQTAWLPLDAVHADLSGEQPFGGGFGISSNGLAGGNSLTEAAIHGLCEAIERDSTARWQMLDRSLRESTRLDASSVTDPDCIALLERLEHADFSVGLWNTTNLTGVASFHAAVLDRRNPDGHPGAGDGCHLSPGIALLRALTEAIQTRLTYIAGTRDDLDPEAYRLDLRRDRRNRHEALLADKPGFDFRQLADHSSATLAADLAAILARLERAGRTAYGVQLGQPEIGLPVLRVVVPGLRLPSEATR